MDRLLEATARAERDHFWFRGFRRFVAPLLAEAAGGATGALALDCGCGTGHNLALLRRHGRAVGVDLTWRGLAVARARGERQVARASAASLPFAGSQFDLVTSFDVLYALDDETERAAIEEMYRVLRPGGHLVVNVAALPALRGRHSLLAGEVRRYRRGDLRERLTRAGFEVRRLTYTNFTLLPIVAGIRYAQGFIGQSETDREIRVPVAPVNLLLAGMLSLEAAVLRVIDMPLGSSLLALARKPSPGV